MTMVIKVELGIFDQIVKSVSFGLKNGNHPTPPPRNAGPLKTIAIGKFVCMAGSYLFMKCDVFRQNADFFKGMECIIFNIRVVPDSMFVLVY